MPGSCEKIDARTHLFVSCCSGVSNYILTYLQFNMRVPAVSVTLLNSSKRQPQDSTWNLKQVWIWKIMEKHIAVEGDCFCVSKSSLFSGIQKKTESHPLQFDGCPSVTHSPRLSQFILTRGPSLWMTSENQSWFVWRNDKFDLEIRSTYFADWGYPSFW